MQTGWNCGVQASDLLIRASQLLSAAFLWRNKPGLLAQMFDGQGSSSALLEFFSKLGSDNFSSVLLPKLKEDGSAGELALTCSKVKDLCYRGVQKLDLSSLMGVRNPQDLYDWTQDIHCHFPGCTCIYLFLDDSVITTPLNVPFLWDGVSGLPKLHTLQLDVQGRDDQAEELLCIALPHKTSLCSLDLQLDSSWLGRPKAWKAIGDATQLTELHMKWEDEVESPCDLGNLAALTGLVNLQVLTIYARGADQLPESGLHPRPEAQLPGCWTALKTLRAHLSLFQDLSSLLRCSELRELELLGPAGAEPDEALSAQDWAVISQLTALTSLSTNVRQGDRAAESCAALVPLKQLRCISALSWSCEALPVFAEHMPHLTRVEGSRSSTANAARTASAQLKCPKVQQLACDGEVPFEAFPNTTRVVLTGAVSSQGLSSMAQHCRALQDIKCYQGDYGTPFSTLLPHAEGKVAGHVSSITSLTALTQLSQLQFACRDDVEAAALASVAEALVGHKLQAVDVVLSDGSEVSVLGLMQFTKARGLSHLAILVLGDPPILATAHEARMLVSILSPIEVVAMSVRHEYQEEYVHEALDWLKQQALPHPGDCSAEVFDAESAGADSDAESTDADSDAESADTGSDSD